jgi:hypothetical protein
MPIVYGVEEVKGNMFKVSPVIHAGGRYPVKRTSGPSRPELLGNAAIAFDRRGRTRKIGVTDH